MRDWKQAERRIARMIGGERVPVSGRGRGYSPDVEHSTLSIEVKSRASYPAWLEDAMRQAEAASTVEARKTGHPLKTPVTVLHRDGKRYADDLVLCRLSDFVRLFTDIREGDEIPTGEEEQWPQTKFSTGTASTPS